MKGSERRFEVAEYTASGRADYSDVSAYDAIRYLGQAGAYKQRLMSSTYLRLAGDLEGKRVLDVGCGTGRGVLDFAPRALDVVAVDASPDMLAAARAKAKSFANCRFVRTVAQALPFPDATFDLVISLNFLHLFRPHTQREMIDEMKRVAKPGGVILVEFDNALHGLGIGLAKRYFGDEPGSLPGEIRYALGTGCRIAGSEGAVLPVVWRLFYRFPRLFAPVEALTRLPVLKYLAHRLHVKAVKL
jgi:ubiquinone/menaquinone biosynthesis C-methylase UbiE